MPPPLTPPLLLPRRAFQSSSTRVREDISAVKRQIAHMLATTRTAPSSTSPAPRTSADPAVPRAPVPGYSADLAELQRYLESVKARYAAPFAADVPAGAPRHLPTGRGVRGGAGEGQVAGSPPPIASAALELAAALAESIDAGGGPDWGSALAAGARPGEADVNAGDGRVAGIGAGARVAGGERGAGGESAVELQGASGGAARLVPVYGLRGAGEGSGYPNVEVDGSFGGERWVGGASGGPAGQDGAVGGAGGEEEEGERGEGRERVEADKKEGSSGGEKGGARVASAIGDLPEHPSDLQDAVGGMFRAPVSWTDAAASQQDCCRVAEDVFFSLEWNGGNPLQHGWYAEKSLLSCSFRPAVTRGAIHSHHVCPCDPAATAASSPRADDPLLSSSHRPDDSLLSSSPPLLPPN